MIRIIILICFTACINMPWFGKIDHDKSLLLPWWRDDDGWTFCNKAQILSKDKNISILLEKPDLPNIILQPVSNKSNFFMSFFRLFKKNQDSQKIKKFEMTSDMTLFVYNFYWDDIEARPCVRARIIAIFIRRARVGAGVIFRSVLFGFSAF